MDREAVARYGLSAAEVFRVLEALGGIQVGTVFEGAMRFPVQVRFPERVRLDPRRLGEIRVAAPAAEPGGPPRMIPLLFVAAILGLLAGLRRVTADAGRRWPVWAWRVPTYAVRTVAAFSEGIGRP